MFPFLSAVAPKRRIMCAVTSRYGAETMLPSTVISESFSSMGETISSDVMNWELTPPSMETFPPRFGPLILTGGRPSLDEHAVPVCSSAVRSGPMGLFLSESSPVISDSPSNIEQMPAKILMVVPEFSASTKPGAWRSPPVMTMTSPSSVTSAPMALHAASVALVSADMSAFDTLDVPFAMEARKNALWVWLLDGGGETVPSSLPPWKAMDVILRTSSLSESSLRLSCPYPRRNSCRPLWRPRSPPRGRNRTCPPRGRPCPWPSRRWSCPRPRPPR